jgi:hypothetical protein
VTEARAALAVERVGGRDGAGGGGTRYEYIAITDHSKGLKIAGGINEEHATRRDIAAVNASLRSEGAPGAAHSFGWIE